MENPSNREGLIDRLFDPSNTSKYNIPDTMCDFLHLCYKDNRSEYEKVGNNSTTHVESILSTICWKDTIYYNIADAGCVLWLKLGKMFKENGFLPFVTRIFYHHIRNSFRSEGFILGELSLPSNETFCFMWSYNDEGCSSCGYVHTLPQNWQKLHITTSIENLLNYSLSEKQICEIKFDINY